MQYVIKYQYIYNIKPIVTTVNQNNILYICKEEEIFKREIVRKMSNFELNHLLNIITKKLIMGYYIHISNIKINLLNLKFYLIYI